MTNYVSAVDLSLTRGDAVLCSGLSLTLQSGQCIHLAGANGRGKTTFIKVLCGLLPPDAGQVVWHQGSPRTHAHYLGHQNALKDVWTVSENLFWTLRLYGERPFPGLWEASLDHMALTHLLDQPVAILSQGEKRRTALVTLGLVPRPVWLLDEPFNALDASAQRRLVGWMNDHTDRGGAILFSSHTAHPDGLQLSGQLSMEDFV